MMDLSNKVCVVTGGTAGIGQGCVAKLASLGAKVIFTGRNIDAGKDIEATLTSQGHTVEFIQQDVADEEQWQQLIQHCQTQYNKIDALVNNAGI